MTTFSYKIETLPRAAKLTSIELAGGDTTDSLGNPILTATFDDQRLHERRERRSGIDAGTDRGGWLRWRSPTATSEP